MKIQRSRRRAAAAPWWAILHRYLGCVARAGVVCATITMVALPAWPQENPKDLTDQSLEDLMNVEVTSASKKEEKLARTAAAVFVITQEDIRRSGATNIPDLLRMVPGMDVGEINGSTWAVSARGFNEQFSNKLLVTIDGRVVYTPRVCGIRRNDPVHDRGKPCAVLDQHGRGGSRGSEVQLQASRTGQDRPRQSLEWEELRCAFCAMSPSARNSRASSC